VAFELRKVVRETEYHDPGKNYELVRVPSEVRYDPFTGEGGRIFPIRKYQLPRFDWEPVVQLSREKFCPFCPEALEKATPRFPEKLLPGGRLRVGEAVVIPNMFPVETYAGVVVMTPEHYLPMSGIPEQTLFDSLRAGIEFLKKRKSNVELFLKNGSGCSGAIFNLIHNHFVYNCHWLVLFCLQTIESRKRCCFRDFKVCCCDLFRMAGGVLYYYRYYRYCRPKIN